MIGQPSREALVGVGGTAEFGVGLVAARHPRHRYGKLLVEAVQRLAKLLGAEQGAPRRAGWHVVRIGTRGQRREPILAHKQPAGGENAPADQIAARDLADRASLDDLGAVVARPLRLALACPRCVLRKIDHLSTPQVYGPSVRAKCAGQVCGPSVRVKCAGRSLGVTRWGLRTRSALGRENCRGSKCGPSRSLFDGLQLPEQGFLPPPCSSRVISRAEGQSSKAEISGTLAYDI